MFDKYRLKTRVQRLKPEERLSYLRQQIAARDALKLEIRQKTEELEVRKRNINAGELPNYARFELESQIAALSATINIDYESQAKSCVIARGEGQQIWNELQYARKKAREPISKANETLNRLRGELEILVGEYEAVVRRENSIVRGGPWEPEHLRPEVIRRRELDQEFERKKAGLERDIASAERDLKSLSEVAEAANELVESFYRWIYTGSLDAPSGKSPIAQPSAIKA